MIEFIFMRISILQFLGLLYSTEVTRAKEDWICWIPTRSGKFKFKAYNVIIKLSLHEKRLEVWDSFFHVDSSSRKYSYHGEHLEAEFLLCRVVLHVQEQWADHRSFTTLRLCTWFMVFGIVFLESIMLYN